MELQSKNEELSRMVHEELCPLCGVSQEMAVSAFHTVGVDARGESHTTITVAYHCRSCGGLARFEHMEEDPAASRRMG
ncbi:MAG: hypothetical protein HY562_09100 [Ignavibacteriales bacterium]|nr:hypothetical protein [Ignavibacteriales bacterium]